MTKHIALGTQIRGVAPKGCFFFFYTYHTQDPGLWPCSATSVQCEHAPCPCSPRSLHDVLLLPACPAGLHSHKHYQISCNAPHCQPYFGLPIWTFQAPCSNHNEEFSSSPKNSIPCTRIAGGGRGGDNRTGFSGSNFLMPAGSDRLLRDAKVHTHSLVLQLPCQQHTSLVQMATRQYVSRQCTQYHRVPDRQCSLGISQAQKMLRCDHTDTPNKR
mmetsp:Transcript_41169/g.69203  ORF Transcript_41169/g.69203 Transcript_41169/m.69203 type:complete len:215 (+) Transcript_41169:356-1000(+)